jgi:S-DNA-T family DNA segregation ATPase FtsK/SpoIIIE
MFRLPRHYIFIDELAAALAESPLAPAALTMVATRGRSLGIHLIAATQSAQGIPRAMLTNLRVRIALAEADPIDLAQLNLKRPPEPVSVLAGWASGIVQKPGMKISQFNFPLGASFDL